MDNVYQTVINAVEQGGSFNVNFKARTLRLGREQLDLSAADLGVDKYTNLDEWLDKVEDLYDDFKYSRPSSTSMQKERRSYFKGLDADELVGECGHLALSSPLSRDVAQAKLESFILLSLINGSFNPDELFNKDWFFQGTDKTLVILKSWF